MTSHTNSREYMKNYMRKRRAAGLDGSRPRKDDLRPEASAGAPDWEGYLRSPNARERSARLDRLVRSRFAKLLGETPDRKPTLTGGDLHRASLPVGYKPPVGQTAGDQQRADDAAVFKDAMKQIFDGLPGAVTTYDVAARLPAAVVKLMGRRLQIQIAKFLVGQGATPREIGIATRRTAKRIYLIDRRLVGMRRGALYDRYYALNGILPPAAQPDSRKRMVNDRNHVERPRAVSGRSSKSKIQGNAPGTRKAAQRPSKGQTARAMEAAYNGLL
jgi:hypothetical protein